MAQRRWKMAGGAALGLVFLAVASRADETAAVETIKKLGGTIEVDAKRPDKPVVGVYLGNSKVTDAGLKELKGFKNLQILNLDTTVVTDMGLKALKELKRLQTLYLGATKITDAGLRELKELKTLRTLYLNGNQITDAGLKELK